MVKRGVEVLNFEFQCKTELIFGKKAELKVGDEVKKYSKNILLVYGGGSIKKTGLYEKIINSLHKQNIKITELSGIKSNPELGLVRTGIGLCRKNSIDFILAVGGGSAIDTAKAIAMGFYYDGDVWDIYSGKYIPVSSLPIATVLTIAAAGSEASQSSVITNENGLIKKGFNCNLSRPVFSILNPELTFSLPDDLTFSGIADMMSHVHERFFSEETNDISDMMAFAILRTIIKNAKMLKENRKSYDSQAQIMLAGTFAHNDLVGIGRVGDYATHKIEQELSALYGVNHAKGIAVMTLAWMDYVYKKRLDHFVKYAINVWDVSKDFGTKEEIAKEGIAILRKFFIFLGLPLLLNELNLPNNYHEDFDKIAERCTGKSTVGNLVKLNKNDVLNILSIALG